MARRFKRDRAIAVAVAIVVLVGLVYLGWMRPRSSSETSSSDSTKTELRILAYSSFTSSWGPGPTLAQMFEERMHAEGSEISVVFLQAEDSGLLLAKMDSFPADVVLGFDQLGLRLARKSKKWLSHGISKSRYSDEKFYAFDWAPIGFVYRKGEIEPPKDFDDLLDARFVDAIALQDPRSSSPGFQFLNWLVKEKGEDAAFQYLAKLKPNVHSMSGSWSQAYGMFTRGLAKITFSYATSILYHRLSEKDDRYQFVTFPFAHPVQVEYAAIPSECRNCDLAKKFMTFLSEPEAQAVIMTRNWMLPTNAKALQGSPFETFLQEIEGSTGLKVQDFSKGSINADHLLKRWREVGL